MKFFLVLFFGACTMVMITRCNSSSSGDSINQGKTADSVAPAEGGSYNKDTTSYDRSTDTGQAHHVDDTAATHQ